MTEKQEEYYLIIREKQLIGYATSIKEAKKIIRNIGKMKGLVFREGEYLIAKIEERFRLH